MMKEIRNKEHSKSNRFMKRIVLMLVLGLGLQISAWAQPTVKMPTLDPCNGDNFCMDVTVDDFTDIISMGFSVTWDPSIIDFVNVGNPNIPMDVDLVDDFDVSMTDQGILTFTWETAPCTNGTPGITLPDDEVMFEICFNVQGTVNYGDITLVEVGSVPEPINVTRTGSNCNNIGLFSESGIVSTCVRPLEIIASNTTGNPGDLICVDYSVVGFDDMTSMQFSVDYDPTILQFENVSIPPNLPNLGISSFGTPPLLNEGDITVSWAFVDPVDPGVTVPDNTSIFQLCFRIIGDCETSSPVTFSGEPTGIELTNTVMEGFALTFLPQDGSVTVSDCDPTGLPLIVDCGDVVDINDNICLPVTTNDFTDITDMHFLVEWNSAILDYDQVININGDIANFDINNFNTANISNGILGVDWEGARETIPDGSVLFEICFNVSGVGGNSPINFTGSPPIVQVDNGTNIGINPTNCEVIVNQPEGVTMSITTGEAPPGEIVCMDVAVANFTDIVEYQFSLTWDESQLTFSSIENINFDFGTILYFNQSGVANGALTFEKDDYPLTGMNIMDGEVVFQICFEVGEMAVPNNCDNVQIVDLPLEAEAITVSSNGNNVGITQQGGEVCVLAPDGFYMEVGTVSGELFDTACVPLTVTIFEDIVSADFQLSFDPVALNCAGFNDLGVIPGITIDESNCGVGLVGFSWTGDALTLPDSTIIMEVCFALQGPPNACYEVDVVSDPEPMASTATADGTIFSDMAGEVCILDKLFVMDSVITGISCPGLEDGMICLRALTGTDSLAGTSNFDVIFNWNTDPIQFGPCAENLPPGPVTVTIFALQAPELIIDTTFIIPDNTTAPTADAGEDKIQSCFAGIVSLEGVSTGNNVTVQWFDILGDPVGVVDENPITNHDQIGSFVFLVTDENGCEARDTMNVDLPELPTAVAAGPGVGFTCTTMDLQLSSDGSSTGMDVAYEWSSPDGGMINPGDENSPNPTVLSPGTYQLVVTFISSSCTDTTSVVVDDEQDFPTVDAGVEAMIGCGPNAEVVLQGSGTSDFVITYTWLDSDGMPVPGGDTDTLVATTPGIYYLEALTEINGCSAIDSVLVEENMDFPSVDVTLDSILTCTLDTITAVATIGNATNYTILWTSDDGAEFVPGTENTEMVQIVGPGTVMVTVTNDDTFCDNTASFLITQDTTPPTAEANTAAMITCADPMVTLDGTGSDTDGVTYEWTYEDDPTVISDEISFEVGDAGTYFLTVTVDSTGCTAVDSVEVENTPDQPSVMIEGVANIACNNQMVELTANIMPADGEYNIQWFLNGNEIMDATELVYVATEPGDYSVVVGNISSGCDDEDEVNVGDDQELPNAAAGDNSGIDCGDNTEVTLDGTGSAEGAEFEYEWMAIVDGETPVPNDQLMTTITTPGTYVIMVTNTLTDCVNTDTVEVADNTALPEITADTPSELISCDNETVNINSSVMGYTEADLTITWDGPDVSSGGTTLNPTVGAGGTYTVTVIINDTGCEAMATVDVGQSDDVPVAIIESVDGGVTLACLGNTVILDGSMSSQGDTIDYSWTVFNGSINLTDADMSMATADNEGQVILTVTNTNTGCEASDTVNILLDTTLVDALAGEDFIGCDTEGSLAGNLPAGTTGMWTTAGGSTISAPGSAATNVTDLGGGENIFTWTLSTDECPEYSFDEVSIFLSVTPEAQNDFIELDEGEVIRDINLTANDNLNGAQNWSVTILGDPALGKVTDNGDGMVTYEPFGGRFGTDEFFYILCNEDCEDQVVCDTALVQIIIPEGPLEVPNGITPNGDGTNDELVFDILNNPDADYPDNQIIIYNRWGDIVYEAKPYNNDWNGVNMSGQELPHATYYYILRLNISEGEIIRGDVTILK